MTTIKTINKEIKRYEKLIQLELNANGKIDIYTILRLNQFHQMKEELLK